MDSRKQSQFVLANDSRERVNQAIACPYTLRSSYGRKFEVRSWKPVVVTGELVSVKIEALVRILEPTDPSNDDGVSTDG